MSASALPIVITCAACGRDGSQPSPPPATASIEPPDFDTRPGRYIRETIGSWVQCCPHCHFCAADLTHVHEGGAAHIARPEYQALLADQAYPQKAREFLAYSEILRSAGHLADGGWSALHAAWICDDLEIDPSAALCRLRAIDLWKNSKQVGQNFSDDFASECALAADVLRRAGQWEEAMVACSEAIDEDDTPAPVLRLLLSQKTFIEAKDPSCHSLSELMRKQ